MNESSDTPSQDIVARAGRYYRNARYIICGMALVAGLWFAYDGWINWPRESEAFDKMSATEKASVHRPHSDTDINLQRSLALFLIPLAPVLLGFFLYRSRGEYRLSGTTLHVPGHPPVPVEAMIELDLSRWKRKGIAYLDYSTEESGENAQLTLDDFVYDQIPTDRIVDQLKSWIGTDENGDVGDDPGEPETPMEKPTTEDAESKE